MNLHVPDYTRRIKGVDEANFPALITQTSCLAIDTTVSISLCWWLWWCRMMSRGWWRCLCLDILPGNSLFSFQVRLEGHKNWSFSCVQWLSLALALGCSSVWSSGSAPCSSVRHKHPDISQLWFLDSQPVSQLDNWDPFPTCSHSRDLCPHLQFFSSIEVILISFLRSSKFGVVHGTGQPQILGSEACA